MARVSAALKYVERLLDPEPHRAPHLERGPATPEGHDRIRIGLTVESYIYEAVVQIAECNGVSPTTLCWAIVHEWVERHAYLEAQGKVRKPTRARVAAASVELDLGAQARGVDPALEAARARRKKS